MKFHSVFSYVITPVDELGKIEVEVSGKLFMIKLNLVLIAYRRFINT
jgi:hypothetical protein